MPFCPSCRSEYRPGIQVCATCDSTALVDALPEITAITDEDDTRAVAITDDQDASRTVEVEGRAIDLMRAFALHEAREIAGNLESMGTVSQIRPLQGILFPGDQQRFEVHVRAADHANAEAHLIAAWKALIDADAEDVSAAVDAGTCPACGSDVPLKVEECPDCGLFVGIGEE